MVSITKYLNGKQSGLALRLEEAARVGADCWRDKQDETAYILAPEIVWKAYDTYGLPLDIIVEAAAYHNHFVDLTEFAKDYIRQQIRSWLAA